MITVTKGQWFPLTISNIQYGGADFDVQNATELQVSMVSQLGLRTEMQYNVTAYNELSMVSDGSMGVGKYTLEISCKGADGKAYRLRSTEPIIEVSASTTTSDQHSARVTGDNWELTADVEMHEGQAETYMALLEEARQKALKAAEDAEVITASVKDSVAQAEAASKEAEAASKTATQVAQDASTAVSNANSAATKANDAAGKAKEAAERIDSIAVTQEDGNIYLSVD